MSATVVTFDGEPLTKREVLIAREAYVQGIARGYGSYIPFDKAKGIAAERYPLPQITRPRVVKDPDKEFSQLWRCVDGVIEHDGAMSSWRSAFGKGPLHPSLLVWPTVERIKLWADLLARPTEEVSE
jgi:hypothetical protein